MINFYIFVIFILFTLLITYLFYKINKLKLEISIIKQKINNINYANKKLPKKQTGFGTGKAKDEHTENEHDIYHY